MKFFVLIVIKYIILKNGMSPNLVMAPALGAGIISVQIRAFRLDALSVFCLSNSVD